MSKGINAASGLLAINDLSRAISNLLQDPSLRETAKFDILFVLTPGGSTNFELTDNFLTGQQQALLDRVKFVISLDHIASDGPLKALTGSVNKKEEIEFSKQTFRTLQISAGLAGKKINFERTVNPGNFYEWDHIKYSDKGLNAITLTSLQNTKFETVFDKYSVFDTASTFNRDVYDENVSIIAEFLVRMIFGIENEDTETSYILDN